MWGPKSWCIIWTKFARNNAESDRCLHSRLACLTCKVSEKPSKLCDLLTMYAVCRLSLGIFSNCLPAQHGFGLIPSCFEKQIWLTRTNILQEHAVAIPDIGLDVCRDVSCSNRHQLFSLPNAGAPKWAPMAKFALSIFSPSANIGLDHIISGMSIVTGMAWWWNSILAQVALQFRQCLGHVDPGWVR